MTKTSLIIQTVCDETGCLPKKVRYKSIPSNLKTHMKASAQSILQTFEKYAQSHGMYRRVVSLVANFILISYQFEINDWFRFYLDVWSAVAFYFSPSNMSANYLKSCVDTFFENTPPSAYMIEKLAYKTPALTRQHECTAMSENTLLHLKQFRSRLNNMMRSSIVAVQKKHYLEITSDASLSETLIDCIVCVPEKYNEKLVKFRTECDNVCPLLFERLGFLLDERTQLGELVSNTISYKVKTANQTGTMLNRILDGNGGDALLYRLIPHLKRYSIANERLLESEGLIAQPQNDTPDVLVEHEDDANVEDAIEDDSDEEESETEINTAISKVWTRRRRPKPFRIAPFCKMQRSMVYYGWTEIKAMFADLFQAEKKALKAIINDEAMTKKRKRKRGEEKPDKDIVQSVEPFFAKVPDQLDVFQHLFDLRKIKGVNQLDHKWRLCCFRTNGIKCVFTFVSGAPEAAPYHGATGLTRPGYRHIPAPEEKVDIRIENRGLYRVNQYRNDMLSLEKEDLKNIHFAVQDPGFNKVIQNGMISATCEATADAVATALCEHDAMWHITQDQLMEQSGRRVSREKEKARRRINSEYKTSIDAFANTRGRSANRKTLEAYVKVAFETFEVMAEELMHTGRAITQWQASRSLQSFLANVANKIFSNASARMYRQKDASTVMTEMERKALQQKLRDARKRKREEKTIAFFGDATFKSTHRGKVAVPKKALLKVMAATGLTFLIGEYNTSKMCPCGIDELTTPKGGAKDRRVRVHKTTGDVCSVLQMVDDRDETSDVNLGLSALKSIQGTGWPLHLCSPCSETI